MDDGRGRFPRPLIFENTSGRWAESRIHSAAMARWYDALIIATSSSVSFPALGRSRTSLTAAAEANLRPGDTAVSGE
jgi:hypothetical protein